MVNYEEVCKFWKEVFDFIVVEVLFYLIVYCKFLFVWDESKFEGY